MTKPRFEPATMMAAASAASGLIKGLSGGPAQLDNTAVNQQLQEREIKARQAEQAAARASRAGEVSLNAQQDASRQRVEALDRIVGALQNNLRV